MTELDNFFRYDTPLNDIDQEYFIYPGNPVTPTQPNELSSSSAESLSSSSNVEISSSSSVEVEPFWDEGTSFPTPSSIFFDSSTEFIYGTCTDTIIKTKINGDGLITYGGIEYFYYCTGIFFDSSTEFIYICDRDNCRIVKTKINGIGRTVFGSYGSGVNQFNAHALFFMILLQNLFIYVIVTIIE
jgi:hypothetical protein